VSTGFLSIGWPVWGVAALVMAGIFTLVWPADRVGGGMVGMRFVILRWFHSLTWVLLAGSFFIRGLNRSELIGPANWIALLGLVVYIIFMTTIVTSSKNERR
jgi:hypothetical protein